MMPKGVACTLTPPGFGSASIDEGFHRQRPMLKEAPGDAFEGKVDRACRWESCRGSPVGDTTGSRRQTGTQRVAAPSYPARPFSSRASRGLPPAQAITCPQEAEQPWRREYRAWISVFRCAETRCPLPQPTKPERDGSTLLQLFLSRIPHR